MELDNFKKIETKLEELTMTNKDLSLRKLNSIIDKLPQEFSTLINSSFVHKRIPKEYLLSSILYSISTSVGLTFYMEALGYKNYGNLYFTIIGSRGDAKSEAIKIATYPIKKMDDEDYKKYSEELMNCNLDTEDEPIRKQILIQNASIEAAHKIHLDNPNSVGISMDEVYSLIEKMGNSNSRDGIAWRTFLLEGYNNGFIDVSRKTTQSFRLNETYPTFLGGLQHQFIPKLFANGNLESGFIDRLLFTPKLTSNSKLSKGFIKNEVLIKYNHVIKNILSYKRQSERRDEYLKQFQIKLTTEANNKLFEYTQKLINRQTEAKPILKEYMSKMQISIHKFCIIIFIMKHCINTEFKSLLEEDIVDLAIELNEYYFTNFKIILEENIASSKTEPSVEDLIILAMKNKASQKAVTELTGLNKGTISKKWNKIKTTGNQQLEKH